MNRMRTADKALAIIRQEDPETDISLRYIRQLIYDGAIPYVQVGRKKLVNVDFLMNYIENGAQEVTQ